MDYFKIYYEVKLSDINIMIMQIILNMKIIKKCFEMKDYGVRNLIVYCC